MPIHASHPPTMDAALARLAAVQPSAYARTRNAIEGAVTGLSPYITHGLLSLRQVLAEVNARHPLDVQHKLVYELGWRAFFRHVWQHRGDDILQSLHAGPLPEGAYDRELPEDIRQARTGVPVIDRAVETLYTTGTLHNHARMWLASYVVHLRKVHWRAGADWLYGHLLDGDLASNHLSWQWVAGTGSSKPYVFNAENVARYAPTDWHSFGSAVDLSYAALDAWAHASSRRAKPETSALTGFGGMEQPAVRRAPGSAMGVTAPEVALIAGKKVWLVHPWSLGPLPADLAPDTVIVGLYLKDFHDVWPWSDARWAFVDTRMAALTPIRWWTDVASLAVVLREASAVQGRWDQHLRPWIGCSSSTEPQRAPAAPGMAPAAGGVDWVPDSPLFPEVPLRCDSFSQWWRRAVKGLQTADDLLAQAPDPDPVGSASLVATARRAPGP
ncbi:deoxyribodipyrimidine photolyase [Roseateles terrae]|nr:FAD-binding domain-containing protein [Roseateles terrae]OWQ90149.1 deoxyribodipyrimidine photolyase [Roseateles terrae]